MNKKLRKSARMQFMCGGPYHPDYAIRTILELWNRPAANRILHTLKLWDRYCETIGKGYK